MYEIFEKLCENYGVTAYKVCKATGITTATISNWKAGRYTPKREKLQKIADYFGVSLDYLMTGKQPEGYYLNSETAAAAQEMFDNPKLRMLFDAEKDISPEDLDAVYAMVMALKRKEGGEDE